MRRACGCRCGVGDVGVPLASLPRGSEFWVPLASQKRGQSVSDGMSRASFLRLCGKSRLAFLRRSHPLAKNWGKAPCAFAGCRGGGSPCSSVYSVYSVVSIFWHRFRVFRVFRGSPCTLAVLRRRRPLAASHSPLVRSTFASVLMEKSVNICKNLH
jgi:hypothetical protein